jgi:hypothetical protein
MAITAHIHLQILLSLWNSDTCKFEILVQGTFLIVDTCTMLSVILTFSLWSHNVNYQSVWQ